MTTVLVDYFYSGTSEKTHVITMTGDPLQTLNVGSVAILQNLYITGVF